MTHASTTQIYTLSLHDALPIFTNEFSKKYPFIKSEIFRSSGEKIQARFLVEHRASTHSADVFQASIIQVYQLKNLKLLDRKSTRLNSSHTVISYAVFCLKKKTS